MFNILPLNYTIEPLIIHTLIVLLQPPTTKYMLHCPITKQLVPPVKIIELFNESSNLQVENCTFSFDFFPHAPAHLLSGGTLAMVRIYPDKKSVIIQSD